MAKCNLDLLLAVHFVVYFHLFIFLPVRIIVTKSTRIMTLNSYFLILGPLNSGHPHMLLFASVFFFFFFKETESHSVVQAKVQWHDYSSLQLQTPGLQ